MLDRKAVEKHSTGEVINLFSADTAIIEHTFSVVANVMYSPIQIAACLALIYLEVKESMFAALAVVVGILPFLALSFIGIGTYFGMRQVMIDKRLKLTNDVLNGIRIVKFYSWTDAFQKSIAKIRSDELSTVFVAGLYWGAATSLLSALPALMPVLVFYTYIKTGNSLEYVKAVTVLQLFGILQSPLTQLPDSLSFFNQSAISIDRILKFITSNDVEEYVSNTNSGDFKNKFDVNDTAICIENANFGWIAEEEESKEKEKEKEEDQNIKSAAYKAVPQTSDGESASTEAVKVKVKVDISSLRSVNSLVDVNLTFKKGTLYGIVGPVGSGKSTLICALLNQLLLKKGGNVYMSGSVALNSHGF